MRGKVPFGKIFTVASRITPAYAGKSIMRMMGAGKNEGSPPRMRGKVFRRCCFFFCCRDHPRVCGEKRSRFKRDQNVKGSPPRMRGKARLPMITGASPGITPAYAGKRLKRSHSIGHFSCILCLFHSVLHRASVSGGSRAGPCAPPCLPAQNTVPV